MLKRVIAWLLLAGFVLLLLNITLFKFLTEISLLIYAIVAVGYFLAYKGKPPVEK